MSFVIAFEITNALLGISNITAGAAFTDAENDKIEELEKKSKKLSEDATTAGALYDDVYYVVSVNLDRVKKALDKLPSDMLENVEVNITTDLDQESFSEEAIQTVAAVLGYSEESVKVFSSLIKVVGFLRFRKGRFDYVPLNEEESISSKIPMDAPPPAAKTEASSLPNTPKLDKLVTGLTVAGIVFGVAGLGVTIGLGVDTLNKLDDAISEVEKKQAQVDAFQTAIKEALNEVADIAGVQVQDNNYDNLVAQTAAWKVMAQDLESYEKAFYYAIKGYFEGNSDEEVKATVTAKSDESKTFPDDGYSIAKTLADGITEQIQKNKTDAELVAYFANENPEEGQRFVLDEYFVSSLRD